jgi:TonB-linked SusC/RagA family outer membrane protein
MKKKTKQAYLNRISFKLFLGMKIIPILFAGMLHASTLYIQDKNINMQFNELSLESVIWNLKKQTGLTFIYCTEDIKDVQVQDINVQNATIEEILNECLENSGLDYSISSQNAVVIMKVEMKSTIKLSPKVIKGNITDSDGLPLPGATIMEKGTINGITTDIDGNYSLNVSGENSVLKISYIGFETQEIIIGTKTTINVILKPSATSLDEVIITGYQNLSPNKSTGATTVIKAESIARKGSSNVIQSLEGQIAGLGLFSDPTQEGKMKFDIRGVTTLAGKTEPLIIVDGFPLEGSISSINPYDVKSVTILKDAAATSIYGARAANGVIVITSKRGKKGKFNIEYRNSFSFTARPDLAYRLNRLTGADLVDYQVKLSNSGEEPPSIKKSSKSEYVRTVVYNILAKVNDDENFSPEKGAAIIANLKTKDNTKQFEKYYLQAQSEQQHDISISGSTDKNTFRASLNYLQNKGQWAGSKTDKINFNIKNHYTFSKKIDIDLIANVGIMNSNKIPIDESIIFNVDAYEELIDKDGNYLPVSLSSNYGYGRALMSSGGKSSYEIQRLIDAGLLDETYYPLKELNEYTDKNKDVSVRLQARLKTKFTKNLTGHFGFQYELANRKNEYYSSGESYAMRQLINNTTPLDFNKDLSKLNIPLGGRLIEAKTITNSYTLRGQLDFNKIFGNHELSTIIGSEIRENFITSSSVDRFGYDKNTLLFKNIDKARLEGGISKIFRPGNYKVQLRFEDKITEIKNRYFSLYGNFVHSYKSKYILSGSIRVDQSNLFGTDPKYRYKPFWSVGAKWRVSEEDFFNVDAINSLSIRVSYGVNGNISNDFGPFNIAEYYRHFLIGDVLGAYVSSPAIKDLRWEKTNSFNIGADLDMFNNRVNLGIDYYHKNTTDLLATKTADPTLGFENLTANDANITNKGIEVSLNTVNIRNGNFTWNTNIVFRYNKNCVTKVVIRESPDEWSVVSGILNIEGAAANSYWVFDYQGVDGQGNPTIKDSQGNTIIVDSDFSFSSVKVKDLVNAGTIDPVYTAALTNRIDYKNFGLSFMFIASAGHVLLKDSYNYNPMSTTPLAVPKDIANAWKKSGDEANTDIPRINYEDGEAEEILKYSTKNIISGDYLRLREIILTYSLPCIKGKKYFKNVTFNARANNLFYLAKNKEGIDPESHGEGRRYFSRKPTFSVGVHIQF